MKANYYLAQAHLELHNYEDAVSTALRAHALCVAQSDKSLAQATALVLRCKKDKWEDMERRRKREGQELEDEMLILLRREKDDMVATCDTADLKQEVSKEYDSKIELLQRTFETARTNEDKRRAVPDWAIDDISFGIFVDPVVVGLSQQKPVSTRGVLTVALDKDWKELRTGGNHGAPPKATYRPSDARAALSA